MRIFVQHAGDGREVVPDEHGEGIPADDEEPAVLDHLGRRATDGAR